MKHLGHILAPVFFALVLLSHHFVCRIEQRAKAGTLSERGSVTEDGFLRHEEYSLYLPGPAVLRAASLGNTSLAADYVWLKSIQYVSKEFREQEKWQKFEWLKRMYETVLELDPHWIQAIRLGGLLLGASGRGVEETTSVLVKGMYENPDSWVLPYEVGVANLFYPDRAGETAKFLEIAASRRTCPEGVRDLVESILPRLNMSAGRLRVAEEQAWRRWQEHRGTALGEALHRNWIEARATRLEHALTEAAAQFQKLTGRYPARIEEMVEARIIRKVPAEPFGLRWHPVRETERVLSEGLVNLFAYRTITGLNIVSEHFIRANMRKPGSLDELLSFGRTLVEAGGLPADWAPYFHAPVDSLGRPYEFDAQKGEVILPEEYTPEKLFPRP